MEDMLGRMEVVVFDIPNEFGHVFHAVPVLVITNKYGEQWAYQVVTPFFTL